MASSDCFVSVVAPLQNDADIVESFLADVLGLLKAQYANYELVLVDDGSTDETVTRVAVILQREKCIRLIRLSRRFGRDIAISAGLDSVIGDFVVVMNPETDPPAIIPQIVERCRRGCGIVYGIRAHRKDEPAYVRLGAKLFYAFFNRVLKVELPPNSTDFRVYSRQSVNAITKIKDRLRYLRTFSGYVGYGSEPFTYEPLARRARPRSKTFAEGLSLAINMTVANSTQPLRMVSVLGLVLSLVCVFHMAYVMAVRLLVENVAPGWTTQQFYSSLMFMFVFTILATLSEYVGRLLGEVRDRPLYYVLEEKNSSVLLVDEQCKNVVTESV